MEMRGIDRIDGIYMDMITQMNTGGITDSMTLRPFVQACDGMRIVHGKMYLADFDFILQQGKGIRCEVQYMMSGNVPLIVIHLYMSQGRSMFAMNHDLFQRMTAPGGGIRFTAQVGFDAGKGDIQCVHDAVMRRLGKRNDERVLMELRLDMQTMNAAGRVSNSGMGQRFMDEVQNGKILSIPKPIASAGQTIALVAYATDSRNGMEPVAGALRFGDFSQQQKDCIFFQESVENLFRKR